MANHYHSKGVVDCTKPINRNNLIGKTAIVTGGALGIGEAYVRALISAGAHVVVADINEDAGFKLRQEFASSITFAHCDVTSWKSQLSVFQKAQRISPNSRIDIVVANAGISTPDPIFFNDIEKDEPDEPKLDITDINVRSVLLTAKLALWFFRKQHFNEPTHDQCLVLQGSVTGYLDIYGAPQYSMSKFAIRGLMRSLRQCESAHGTRVNMIAPWYVKTKIITDSLNEAVEKSGVGFATLEDAGQALLRIASDNSIHGRSIGVVPRDWSGAPNGCADMDEDDFDEKRDPWMHRMQVDVLRPVRWIQSERANVENVY